MAAAAAGKSHHGSEVKTQFCTKEGCYRSLKLSDYSRPIRTANNAPNNIPVRISFVTLKGGEDGERDDRIVFNVGRDMFFYNFRGSKKAPDLNHPIDRRTYKGPQPTCHDINLLTRSPSSIDLLIGFTAGQIQLMDPVQHECRKCFNDERLIEKGMVTCVKWIPGSESKFLVSYNNPHIYLYDKNLESLVTEPQLSTIKQGNGFSIEVCKNKQDCNPLSRWRVGHGGVNEMAFSPDCKNLAIVSQDGYLRVFKFEEQELIGSMRSYFGGLLCVCWSPDGRYIVTGGEDDLITIWSCLEQRVIARGEGHRSWINVVSFDAYTTNIGDNISIDSDDDDYHSNSTHQHSNKNTSIRSETSEMISYRVGSVGDDTQLLLWDIGEEVLKPQRVRTRSTRANTVGATAATLQPTQPQRTMSHSLKAINHRVNHEHDERTKISNSKFNTLDKISSKHNSTVAHYTPPQVEMDDLILGSNICPRMNDSTILEPLVAKKISYDRLSSLVFQEDCIITASYEGYIHVWSRPEQQDTPDGSTLIQ